MGCESPQNTVEKSSASQQEKPDLDQAVVINISNNVSSLALDFIEDSINSEFMSVRTVVAYHCEDFGFIEIENNTYQREDDESSYCTETDYADRQEGGSENVIYYLQRP